MPSSGVDCCRCIQNIFISWKEKRQVLTVADSHLYVTLSEEKLLRKSHSTALQMFQLFHISGYNMNFVSELSRQGEKPSHPYMSRTDLSRRRARGRGGRDSLSFLSPLYCRANNFGARLTSTLVVAEKVIVCQTSRARAHNCATNRADSATWPQGGRASASRLPSVFISHSVSGGGARPKAEDQSLLHICQGDRSLRHVPSGTMTPSLTRS